MPNEVMCGSSTEPENQFTVSITHGRPAARCHHANERIPHQRMKYEEWREFVDFQRYAESGGRLAEWDRHHLSEWCKQRGCSADSIERVMWLDPNQPDHQGNRRSRVTQPVNNSEDPCQSDWK